MIDCENCILKNTRDEECNCNCNVNCLDLEDNLREHDKQIRADVIEEIKKYTYRNIHFFNTIEEMGFHEFLEELKEQK